MDVCKIRNKSSSQFSDKIINEYGDVLVFTNYCTNQALLGITDDRCAVYDHYLLCEGLAKYYYKEEIYNNIKYNIDYNVFKSDDDYSNHSLMSYCFGKAVYTIAEYETYRKWYEPVILYGKGSSHASWWKDGIYQNNPKYKKL